MTATIRSLRALLAPGEEAVRLVPVFLALCVNCSQTREVSNARCVTCGSERIMYRSPAGR